MLKIIIVGVFLGLLQLSTAATTYGNCMTPKNETALCIELTKCNSLYDLFQKVILTAEERTFLSKSQCGYRNKNVLVCCPSQAPDEVNLPRAGFINTQYCGNMLSNRIVGGNVTAIDEYPWMALIEYTKPKNEKGFHCGGTLINNRYVITAAHCLLDLPEDWWVSGVRLGEWDLETDPDCETDSRGRKDCAPKHVEISIEERIPHPQYSSQSRTRENDIALLRLSESVPFNDFIMPVCLPSDESFRKASFVENQMDITGWGRTEKTDFSKIKLKATITVWDFERCKSKYTSQQIVLQSTQMCAGGMAGIDSCKGDSGGPLVNEQYLKNRSAFYLIGIASFGPKPCALSGWPGIYTRVADYIDWIDNTIKP